MEIKKFKLQNKGNIKGTVYEVMNKEFGNYGFCIIYRSAGPANEYHFHKGIDKSCDPQKLILLKGKLLMTFRDLKGNKTEIELKKGEYVEIPKMILHNYKCLENAIYLESREQQYHPDSVDTFYLKDFH